MAFISVELEMAYFQCKYILDFEGVDFEVKSGLLYKTKYCVSQ